MGEVVRKEDIEFAVKRPLDDSLREYPYVFITSGTGIPDEMAVEQFKNTSIIVITRDGTKWQYGEKVEE